MAETYTHTHTHTHTHISFLYKPVNQRKKAEPQCEALIGGSVYFWQEVQIALRDVDIEGTAEADLLSGEGDGEVIFGLNDRDTIEGGGGNDRIWGRAPFDLPGADPANIIGQRGDRIFGNSGNDIIYGGQGNDRIFGGRGMI